MSKRETRFELPADHRAEHRVIREKFHQGSMRPSFNDLIESGEIDPDSVTTVGDHQAFQEMICRLSELRKSRGLSLREVASRIGTGPKMDAAAISRLESGQNYNPTINTVARYARALNQQIVWNFEEIPDDPPPEGGD